MFDAFVAALGFDDVIPKETARPSYHPATILKIYIYGYLNQVQSSRGLERECRRNLETDLAHGAPGARLQDHADFPPRQRLGHPQGVPVVRRALPRP
ncbi:transposase [Hyphomicrobium sp.]|uniref:transposase n=1 Tax=Hyphomicrobium sp. TaxID=82 RepID=UPI003F7111AD